MQSALFSCIVDQVMATESEKNKVFVKYFFFFYLTYHLTLNNAGTAIFSSSS